MITVIIQHDLWPHQVIITSVYNIYAHAFMHHSLGTTSLPITAGSQQASITYIHAICRRTRQMNYLCLCQCQIQVILDNKHAFVFADLLELAMWNMLLHLTETSKGLFCKDIFNRTCSNFNQFSLCTFEATCHTI